jgi:hypothetical protein
MMETMMANHRLRLMMVAIPVFLFSLATHTSERAKISLS